MSIKVAEVSSSTIDGEHYKLPIMRDVDLYGPGDPKTEKIANWVMASLVTLLILGGLHAQLSH